MEESRLRIMILDDEPAHAEAIRRAIEYSDPAARILVAATLREYRAAVAETPPDIALVDLNLPDGRAVELLSFPPESGPFPILVMTSYGNEQTAVESLKRGALDYAVKSPTAFAEMPRTVARAMREWKLLQERKSAEEALRESNRRLQLATSSAELGVWDWDIDSDHLVVDDRMLELYGIRRSDFIGRMRAWEDALHQDDRERAIAALRETLLNNRNMDFEFRIIRTDGNIRHIRSNAITIRNDEGRAIRMIGLNQDITDKKILQEQLRQSQKMEAIGTLAGGIAHDFNNILTAIAGYSTLLMIGLKTGGRPQEYVDNLMALVERAANLTRGLLAFSRSQTMTLKQINLNSIVTTMNKLISRLIGEDIAVETNLSPCPLTVMADSGQIEQVLMNLATNARDAMHDGGTLTIATELVNLGADEQLLVDSVQPGPYARLTVSDTGIGMDESTAGRIFEPFFTTKEADKGTGLGLSIIYGIVKQHNGLVTVASRPGEGTTFTIHFPIVAVAETSANGKASSPVAGGTETILVAEDDAAIRTVIRHILQQFGYGIMEAADGDEAVNIFREHAAGISLVILDAVMPRKNAREAFTGLQEIKPDVRTLFISGYPADVIAHRGMLPEGAVFLPKPISPIDLLRSIRLVLDGQRENGS